MRSKLWLKETFYSGIKRHQGVLKTIVARAFIAPNQADEKTNGAQNVKEKQKTLMSNIIRFVYAVQCAYIHDVFR